MKIQRVYTDTSVIGGCFDLEFAPWSNGLIKDFFLRNFKPVISELVSAEIEDAPEHVKEKYSELLACNPELIDISEHALKLADVYQQRKILNPKFYDDGIHIALASISEVDVLVNWNFKHIVHFDKIRQFNAVNLEFGYKQLQIYSPREVTNYEERINQNT